MVEFDTGEITMNKSDVLKEFAAAMRRLPNCPVGEKEMADVVKAAEQTKPLDSTINNEANADLVRRLRALRT